MEYPLHILITGGRGVVGTALATELAQRGHIVTCCDMTHCEHETGFRVNDLTGDHIPVIRQVRCDVRECRQLHRLFEKWPFDMVYHAAAEFGRWNGQDVYENLWATNVIGTKHLIGIQETNGFKLVHFSSSEVYGDYNGMMSENVMDTKPIRQLNDYAMTKWVNEMQIRNSIKENGTKTVVVRLFNLYGPGEYYSPYRSVNCRFLYLALHNQPFTVYRGHTRTSGWIPDAVRALANIADNFMPGETYNIGSTSQSSIEDLAKTIIKVTESKSEFCLMPIGEPMTTERKTVDNSKAVSELGYRDTVPLDEGIAITAEWMRKIYSL